jgi:3-oxoacyl-[acyl-carrier protein] reductase
MQPLLPGQVAIITGAGHGIGAAAARLLASEGASVVVNSLHAQAAQEVTAEIERRGGRAVAIAGDVTDPDFPGLLIEKTVETFGAPDILVNNAGHSWDGMLHKMTDRQWEAMLELHVTAPFRLIRAAAPFLRDAARCELAAGRSPRPRSIVNVSSVGGVYGNAGEANYCAAKAALIGLTRTIAKEWGPLGIRCNAIAFGFISTRLTGPQDGSAIELGETRIPLGITDRVRDHVLERTPLGRAGTPEEAADSILYLASPLSSFVTGHVLEVTGGFVC